MQFEPLGINSNRLYREVLGKNERSFGSPPGLVGVMAVANEITLALNRFDAGVFFFSCKKWTEARASNLGATREHLQSRDTKTLSL